MATAKIQEVSINTRGEVAQYSFKLSNGQWHNITKSYMDKVLASKLGAGTSHLILAGAMCEYATVTINNGDAVVDDRGEVVEGKFYANLTAERKKIINFQIDWEMVADKFLTKQMNSQAIASFYAQVGAAFGGQSSVKQAPVLETVAQEDPQVTA